MKVDNIFPSKYFKAADFEDAPRTFTIKAIAMEEIGPEKESKPVFFFDEDTKGFVCNKTNLNVMAYDLGGETDNWLSKQVELRREIVSFAGKPVASIRVRAVSGGAAVVAAPVEPAPFHDDDVNF